MYALDTKISHITPTLPVIYSNSILHKLLSSVVLCKEYKYNGTSEQWTLWDQYKLKWFVPCIEVVLLKRFQLHYINRGIKLGDFVLSIVERYLILCPFLGGSSLIDSTVSASSLAFSNFCAYVQKC